MPPIVAIVGKSESGKTTLIEALISELKSRGYRVATAKHASHGLNLDKPGKDSWRYSQAGSKAIAIASPDQIVLIKSVPKELELDEVAHILGEDYDIIIAEGFKQSSAPKIEIHRKAVGPPLGHINNLIAIVSDEPLGTKTRQFSLYDIKGLADLLEKSFIKPQLKKGNKATKPTSPTSASSKNR
jgi:molybdopterin-guanine dinucleotide biosynthesis protein B